MRSFIIHYGNFLFKYRNVLFPVVLLALFVLFRPVPFLKDTALDFYMDIAGVLIILSGLGLRAAVIGLAYIKRGGVNKKIHANTLVTNGLFAHCRNPLYVGNLLVVAGLLVIFNNPWVYLAGGGFFVFSYIAIVHAEECFLAQKFGNEYTEYCARVNRWTFRTAGLRDTLHSMEFNWIRVAYKDYTTMLTWIITATLVLNLEHLQYFGLQNSYRFALQSALVMMIAALLAYLVRRSKKSAKPAKN
jgi:protein-S-isoprenylcysteine O-methyltransferase Ste14